jgi:hypothetical protein
MSTAADGTHRPAITGRPAILAAGYTIKRAHPAQRCDGCMHVDQTPIKQHGRYCKLHWAEVKTHGGCNKWEAA